MARRKPADQTNPDNRRSGVTRPDRYEAEINPSYRELAQHYGTCVMPVRIRKPRTSRTSGEVLNNLAHAG